MSRGQTLGFVSTVDRVFCGFPRTVFSMKLFLGVQDGNLPSLPLQDSEQ